MGCQAIDFESDFASRTARSPKSNDDLAGDWQGNWRLERAGNGDLARAMVLVEPRSKYTIELDLSHFSFRQGTLQLPLDDYCIDLKNISISRTSDGVAQFEVRTKSVAGNDRAQAEPAITFIGNVSGDALEIWFEADGVSQGRDRGRILLSRFTATTGGDEYRARGR